MSAVPKPSKQEIDIAQEGEKARIQEEKILATQHNWAGLYEAKSITHEEKQMLEAYTTQDRVGRLDMFNETGDKIAALFLKTIASIRNTDITQYVLTLIDQVLQAESSKAVEFHRLRDPYSPFLRIINSESDAYSIKKASRILAVLLSTVTEETKAVEEFMTWLISKLSTAQGADLVQFVTYLKEILKRPENQRLFVDKDGLSRLCVLMQKETQNTQLLYLIGFCVWLLTFNSHCLDALKKANVVKELHKLVTLSLREKIIRISFAAFRNLLDKEQKFNEDMIGFGLLKVTQGLLTRTWKDKDIEDDIKAVSGRLEKSVEDLTSFEMYETEIKAGNLSWTPVHSEMFWRENVMKFEREENGDKFGLVRRLVQILDPSNDAVALEVAAYDLGEFARFYPDGKTIIGATGKGKLMNLLSHNSPKVRKQALLCIQKLMVQNWEFFDKKKGGKGKEKGEKEKE